MKKAAVCTLFACLLTLGAAGIATAEAQDKAVQETAEAAQETLTIGEDSEGGFAENLKNLTGKDITAVSVKATMDQEYGENLLSKDEIYSDGEECILYYPHRKIEDGSGRVSAYDIKFVFADKTEAVVHTFPFNDMKNGELHLEDGVAYLVFDSISLGYSINTLDREKAGSLTSDQVYYYDTAGEEYFGDTSGGSGGNGGGNAGGAACLTGGLIN